MFVALMFELVCTGSGEQMLFQSRLCGRGQHL